MENARSRNLSSLGPFSYLLHDLDATGIEPRPVVWQANALSISPWPLGHWHVEDFLLLWRDSNSDRITLSHLLKSQHMYPFDVYQNSFQILPWALSAVLWGDSNLDWVILNRLVFFKVAQAGGREGDRTWNLVGLHLFTLSRQNLRPLSNCAP